MKGNALSASITGGDGGRFFVARAVSIVLLLFVSLSLVINGIVAFSPETSRQVVGADNAIAPFVVDTPRDGVLPFDGSNAYVPLNEVTVSASAAFLCTAGGQVLYAKQYNTKLPMASITKVMTALVVIENSADLHKTVAVSPIAVGTEGNSVYLKAGDSVTVLELLYALMLASANDSAIALAVETAGSVEAFVSLMNEKAVSLGMSSTAFIDPHGLGGEGHYTTARDYALLMAYAINVPVFREIAGTLRKTILINGVSRPLYNHNRLLYSCEGVFCGKTGYTIASGRTLVTAAERNGVTLICVTLNASDDWNDHRRLYSIGFSYANATELKSEDMAFLMPITGGNNGCSSLRVAPERDVRIIALGDFEHTVRYSYPVFVYAPISEGERVGYLNVSGSGGVNCSVPIVATEEITAENQPKGMLWRLNAMWRALTNKEKDS